MNAATPPGSRGRSALCADGCTCAYTFARPVEQRECTDVCMFAWEHRVMQDATKDIKEKLGTNIDPYETATSTRIV